MAKSNCRFPGKYFDTESGLHYNYHRYYDPSIGRYLRADPIGLAGMDPNLFGYVKNNPINRKDPTGLIHPGVWVGAIAGGLSGFNAGIVSGNWKVGLLAGVTGGFIGGVTGAINPTWSAQAAATIGGLIGGAAAGAASNVLDPCAKKENLGRDIFFSGMIGGVTGFLGGSFIGATGITGYAVETGAAIAIAPVNLGLSSFVPMIYQ